MTGILVMGLVAACLAPTHTRGVTAAVQVTTSEAGATVPTVTCTPSLDPVDATFVCPCPGRDVKRGRLVQCKALYGLRDGIGNRCLAIYEHGTVATP